MTAARLILLLLLILIAVVIVLVVLRRGSAQRDAQRVEAAGLRADADTMATTVAGQSVFADQATQRAELARVEAEDKASEAARLEAEAAEHRAAAEATQRDYEATLRRADDIDPDVKESAYPAVADEVEPAPTVSGSTDAAPDASGAAAAADADDDELPMTRAERREAREAAGGSAPETSSAEPSGAAAATAGAVAAGTTAWTSRDHDESNPESERIASAADFRDDVPEDPTESDGSDGSTASAGSAGSADPTGSIDEAPAPDGGEVYAADSSGTESDMSDDSRTDTAERTPNDDGIGAGQAATAAAAGGGGAYAATRALHEEQAQDTTDADRESTDAGHDSTDTGHDSTDPDGDSSGVERETAPAGAVAAHADHADAGDDTAQAADGGRDAGHEGRDAGHDDTTDVADADERRSEPGDDLSHDVESPRGEWGGPPQDETPEMTIVEPERYATTEPVMASEQTAPVQPDAVDTDGEASDREVTERHDTGDEVTERHDTDGGTTGDEVTHRHDADGEHAPAEAGAAVAETDDTDRSAADMAEERSEERYDPTPTRDWAADEGELLDETHDRGDRLEAERADLAHDSDEASGAAATDDATASDDATGATASDDATGATASDDATDATASDDTGSTAAEGRRVSGFDELRDGGFGVGSAAPLDDGAQPLDHPVAAYRDTMTYRLPGDTGYESAEPHVWFYDEGAAERNGFRRSEG